MGWKFWYFQHYKEWVAKNVQKLTQNSEIWSIYEAKRVVQGRPTNWIQNPQAGSGGEQPERWQRRSQRKTFNAGFSKFKLSKSWVSDPGFSREQPWEGECSAVGLMVSEGLADPKLLRWTLRLAMSQTQSPLILISPNINLSLRLAKFQTQSPLTIISPNKNLFLNGSPNPPSPLWHNIRPTHTLSTPCKSLPLT